eukprot:Seg143.3 transcript_id=Seg143.3/GoldUCD/mRNA.D3Y31 product="hypothetical protein" protein_id=Seg143.3/GoldUCD/D3Y31
MRIENFQFPSNFEALVPRLQVNDVANFGALLPNHSYQGTTSRIEFNFMTNPEEVRLPEELIFLGKDMKYRKEELCKVDGCAKQWTVFKDLTRHLRIQHNLTRKQYESKYPKMDLQVRVTKFHDDSMSLLLPGEKCYVPKPDIGHLYDFPAIPGNCPIRDEQTRNCTIKDEEKGPKDYEEMYPKSMFLAKWLEGAEKICDEGKMKAHFDEYPKKRIYYFEAAPSHMLLARNASLVYDKERSGFEIVFSNLNVPFVKDGIKRYY